MFQFNFSVQSTYDKENVEMTIETEIPEKKWIQAKPLHISSTHFQSLSEENTVEEVTIGRTQLKYLRLAPVLKRLEKNGTSCNIASALTDNTDLVPAVYEGGLKIWECTWDLLSYMASSCIKLDGCRVLELGCGAALPAIYAMLQGAHITVQDYNEEVINNITMQNILLNLIELAKLEEESPDTLKDILDSIPTKVSFYSGDWGELDKLFKQVRDADCKYDLILTSETIYSPECHEKLVSLMTNHLKEDGKILLAAKSYYFGVGGGIHQFCDLVEQKGKLITKTVYATETGVKREILELTLKSSQ